jgi:hypothetical protein
MAAKTTPQKAKRKNASKTSKANPPPAAASALSMVTQNLINMVVVSAVSGTVLLGLLAASAGNRSPTISIGRAYNL